MKYTTIFELRVVHPYYADGRCPDFRFEPDPATQRLIRGHRGLVKDLPDGFALLLTADAEGHALLPFTGTESMRFRMVLLDPGLVLFSDLTALSGLESPLFVGREGEESTSLEDSQEPLASGAFAGVEIRGPGVLPEKGAELGEPHRFRIELAERRARWAYYLVTDSKDAVEDLSIVDAGTPAAGSLLFSPANRRELGEEDELADPVAGGLALQHPELRRLRFLSDDVVPSRQTPRKNLELRTGTDRLHGPLPNPSLRSYSTVETKVGETVERHDSLFRIVKLISNTHSTNGD